MSLKRNIHDESHMTTVYTISIPITSMSFFLSPIYYYSACVVGTFSLIAALSENV